MFQRLLPVLPVCDLDGEVAFYVSLGFSAQVTFTGFTALRYESVLFGVQASAALAPPADLSWQMEVADVRAVHDLAIAKGLQVLSSPSRHPVGFWTVQLYTPSGYTLTLEGPERADDGAGPDQHDPLR